MSTAATVAEGPTLPSAKELADIPLDELSALLDAATHEERVAWMYSIPGGPMRKLFKRAEGYMPVSLDQILPPDGTPAPCVGRNGMPLFNRFAKVFAEVDGQGVGYNRNSGIAAWFGGPGHYVCYDAAEGTDGQPGEVVVDYRKLPERTHPDFPKLRSNWRGGSIFVFAGMYDVVRRISRDVLIGDSFKPIGGTAPFMLVQSPR